MEQQQLHRVHLTEEHFHLARQFMVTKRLRSTRVAVERMIELVSEWEDEKESVPAGKVSGLREEDDQGRRDGHL